jgi:hypothetical protein
VRGSPDPCRSPHAARRGPRRASRSPKLPSGAATRRRQLGGAPAPGPRSRPAGTLGLGATLRSAWRPSASGRTRMVMEPQAGGQPAVPQRAPPGLVRRRCAARRPVRSSNCAGCAAGTSFAASPNRHPAVQTSWSGLIRSTAQTPNWTANALTSTRSHGVPAQAATAMVDEMHGPLRCQHRRDPSPAPAPPQV